ncbi:MAG: YigZ family protein [Clostridia bacterium]|nr:YigZ family protein [Clostridia bacterium]
MNIGKIKRLKHSAEIEFTEKKSLFIGYSAIVKNEEEALQIIKERKKKFSDATHNVYAYMIGDGTVARYSDDGEPQGTSGMPTLNSIRMSGITDVCVVITRYFGGILLGAGGLVRAYSTAASMALEAGEIAVFEKFLEYKIVCSYSEYNKLQTILSSYNVIIDGTEFNSDITVLFAVPEDISEKLKLNITEIFAAKLVIEPIGERFDTK